MTSRGLRHFALVTYPLVSIKLLNELFFWNIQGNLSKRGLMDVLKGIILLVNLHLFNHLLQGEMIDGV